MFYVFRYMYLCLFIFGIVCHYLFVADKMSLEPKFELIGSFKIILESLQDNKRSCLYLNFSRSL